MSYWRPIPSLDPARPEAALPLAGGWAWFDRIEVLERGRAPLVIPALEAPREVLDRLSVRRPALPGMAMDRPAIMGVVNVTPDSFSDGGLFLSAEAALAQGRALAAGGADILDIGGESTRPGAGVVPAEEEIARVAPVLAGLAGSGVPLSIDTRKAAVAEAALAGGAAIVNDVSALQFNAGMAGLVARAAVPLCLMHVRGTPETMQQDPRYDDVVLDIYDWLAERIAAAEAAGIPRARLIADPGIGFGKTLSHNLALLRRISLFHGLGCAILVGASRKRFIGTIGGADAAADRMPGSVAVALAMASAGVQVVRVHDVAETRQALALHLALASGAGNDTSRPAGNGAEETGR